MTAPVATTYPHYAKLVCEMHRYPSEGHRTDVVSVLGLDDEDRRRLMVAFADHLDHRAMAAGIAFREMDHLAVLNTLCRDRGYRLVHEPKPTCLPMSTAAMDFRYLLFYLIVKDKMI